MAGVRVNLFNLAVYLPCGLVFPEEGERAHEPLVDLIQRQLLVRRLNDTLKHVVLSKNIMYTVKHDNAHSQKKGGGGAQCTHNQSYEDGMRNVKIK